MCRTLPEQDSFTFYYYIKLQDENKYIAGAHIPLPQFPNESQFYNFQNAKVFNTENQECGLMHFSLYWDADPQSLIKSLNKKLDKSLTQFYNIEIMQDVLQTTEAVYNLSANAAKQTYQSIKNKASGKNVQDQEESLDK